MAAPAAEPREAPAPAGRSAAWPALIVIVAALGVHANTLRNGFVDDDNLQVLANPWIRDAGHLGEIFSHGVWSFLGEGAVSNYYRPLMHVVYMAAWQLFGPQAWGFHLVNLLFHAASAFLVLRLARRLDAPASLGAALLFAVHPIQTEAVAWIASLPELSYAFLLLLALLLHARAPRPLGALHLLSAALFLLAALCKETALVFVLLAPAWDLARGEDRRGPGEALRWYGPSLATAGIYLAARYLALSGSLVAVSESHGLGLPQLLLNAGWLLAAYLGAFLAPAPLNFWHRFEPVAALWSAKGIAACVVPLGLAGAIVAARRRSRVLFFGLVLGVVPLLPALYLRGIHGKPFAERYLYLPSAGLAIAGVWALMRLLRGRGRIAWAILLAALAAGASASVMRNETWRDPLTLFTDTVRKSPEAPQPRYMLGLALHEKGRFEEAIVQYRLVVASRPREPRYRAALGDALLAAGRPDEALEQLRAALEQDPRSREAANDLGTALHRLGRIPEAIEAYQRALSIDPDHAEAHYNLGVILAQTGRAPEALGHLETAVRLRPANADWRNVLGIEYAKRGRTAEAIAELEEAVRLAPGEPGYRRNLDRVLREGGR